MLEFTEHTLKLLPALRPDFIGCKHQLKEVRRMSHNFKRGCLVWAKMPGYPWWPAMVDNDPDYNSHFRPKTSINEAKSLHVVFLDKEVSRRWIDLNYILPFDGKKYTFDSLAPFIGHRNKDYTNKVKTAYGRATAAIKLPVDERLKLFGFVPRFHDNLYESSLSETDVHVFSGAEPVRTKRFSKKKRKISEEMDLRKKTSRGKNDSKDKYMDVLF